MRFLLCGKCGDVKPIYCFVPVGNRGYSICYECKIQSVTPTGGKKYREEWSRIKYLENTGDIALLEQYMRGKGITAMQTDIENSEAKTIDRERKILVREIKKEEKRVEIEKQKEERRANKERQKEKRRLEKEGHKEYILGILPIEYGFVYIIRNTKNWHKIGMTINLDQRFSSLRRKYGNFDVIHTIETFDMRNLEWGLHTKYREKCIYGEWFNLSPDDLDYLRSLR